LATPFAGDHHRGRVHAPLAPQPLEAGGGVEHLAGLGVVVAGHPQLGRELERLGQGALLAQHRRGHGLGQVVAQLVGEPEHPGRVADGLLGLDGGEGDDLGDVVGPVLLGGVADHVAAPALVEVQVDVGHLVAARVEEPLEHQPVGDRVEVGDAQAVGDARPGGAPPPRADPDAVLAGVAAQVGHDQEVAGEAEL
jgi:hypothetical protein